jgi:hypothetical protein
MGAGDVSKKLAFKIRNILGDLSKSRIRSDVILFDLLSRFQREFMSRHNTTTAKFTITLTTALEYPIDVTAGKIVKIYVPDTQERNYEYDVNEQSRKLILTDREGNEPVTGDVIYYDAYLKPTVIDENTDPVIGTDYEPYLVDAVLTQYPTKGIPQTETDIEVVHARVKEQAVEDKKLNKFGTRKVFRMNF